jgi:NADPH:quinone reductase-like Zn-dependent oxidoreductase
MTSVATRPGPLTCAAVVATRNGGPEVLEVRRWAVRPPGPDEVRVRVDAVGISFADLLECKGLHPERYYPRRRRTPFVPGWDVVGVVESVGAQVSHVGPGQRVAALSIVGGWAEYAVVPAAWTVPLSAALEPTKVVCLLLDYMTAYQMLIRSAGIRRGDTVLIQGAAGGVGTALLQLARHLGVRALGTAREARRAYVESEGGVLIDFEHEDVARQARALTGGRGVDAAFDGLGTTAWASLRALRAGGHLVGFGYRGLDGMLKLAGPLALGLVGNLRPGGTRTSIYSIQWLARRHPDWYRQDLTVLVAMLAAHEITPRIAAVHSLVDVPAALKSLAGHAPPGKQVVVIGSTDSSSSGHVPA